MSSSTSDLSKLSLEEEGFGHCMRKYFQFDDEYVNLNHGSFGTYPTAIRNVMHTYQSAFERRPDEFNRYTYPDLLEKSRQSLVPLLNVPGDEIVFIPNATTGIDTVLRSLVFKPGDKILHFKFIYRACGKMVEYIQETTPAVGVKIDLTFPVSDAEVVGAFRSAIEKERGEGGRVRVAIFDTIVSLPAIRLPFEELVGVCKEFGVLSLVDGAHGIGHLPLDLGALGADFFVGGCHKWLYVPRGCAILHVPKRNQPLIRSSIPTSHGYYSETFENPLPASQLKSRFMELFEFAGTTDNSPQFCIPAALEFRAKVCGGEEKIMRYCMCVAKAGAELIADRLGTEVLQKDGRECCMYNVRLPIDVVGEESIEAARTFINEKMVKDYDTYIAVIFYGGEWWGRVSGQIYLEGSDFELGAGMLEGLCKRIKRGEHLESQNGKCV